VEAAGEILAKALYWREEHKDLLTGARPPVWQGDLRILTRGVHGHPVAYLCFRHQPLSPSVQSALDHAAVVLEAAMQAMSGGVQTFDAVIDCHGFRLLSNLDPRALIGLLEMVKQPYRDRLRTVLIVDAPLGFAPLWQLIAGALPEATRKKIRFTDAAGAAVQLGELDGPVAGQILEQVMARNRDQIGPGALPKKLPSELHDAAEAMPTSGSCIADPSGLTILRQKEVDVKANSGQRHWFPSFRSCCHRRSPVQDGGHRGGSFAAPSLLTHPRRRTPMQEDKLR